jgi:cytosine/adenosine deaminase-related metal-dependent hydrolase
MNQIFRVRPAAALSLDGHWQVQPELKITADIPGDRLDLSDREILELPSTVVLPGFANCHTHLEFSGLESPIPANEGFVNWIRGVIAARQVLSTSVDTAWARGLEESYAAGTRLLVDMTPSELVCSPENLRRLQTHCATRPEIVIQLLVELLDPNDLRRDISAKSLETLRNLSLPSSLDLSIGTSPHAPYSTSRELVGSAVSMSANNHQLISMHLAETVAEIQYLTDGSGPFAKLADKTQFPMEARLQSIDDAIDLLSAAPRSLIAHGNYLTASNIDRIAQANRSCPNSMAIVYCPRTHAHFQHERHPLEALRKARIPILLGSDSRASNPDLSILKEAIFLHREFPELDALEVLRMASTDAIEFLDAKSQFVDGKHQAIRASRWLAISTENFTPEGILASAESQPRALQSVLAER